MNEQNYDYGACHICGEQMIARIIKQDFWLKNELIVIEDVPAGVCPQCGEKIVRAEVGQQIALLVANTKHVAQTCILQVPVIHFEAKVA